MSKISAPLSFPQWQAEFAQSLLSDLHNTIEQSLQHDSLNAKQQRFAIYQNNVFYSLSNALASLYPVIKKLVGDDFFTGTATYYLRENPPQQAAMVHFGQDFSTFLSHFEHTASMTYLPHVAQLELARHKAYHACDAPPLSIEFIATIAPEALAEARFTLHPSLHFVQSAHPIFDIWQANQEDNNSDETINLNEPQQVLVVRPLYDVYMYNVDLSTYQFINCLSHGHTLQEAIEITAATHPEFNVSEALNFSLQTQLFTQITPHKN